jgi:hypothetical protein
MKVEQRKYVTTAGWAVLKSDDLFDPEKVQLVLTFGSKALLEDGSLRNELHQHYPNANIVYSSTAGQILGAEIEDDALIVSALQFEKTNVEAIIEQAGSYCDCYSLGSSLSEKLQKKDLCHILVISDGHIINGSELINGLNSGVNESVIITGGLAGDGDHFGDTIVGLNQTFGSGYVVAIGFYGEDLKVGFGSESGWTQFGPERMVTEAEENVLYKIDAQNALGLYKKYLGPKADELPGSALLFPLSIRTEDSSDAVVRTILSVDEKQNSMTFAGDIPVGSKVRLMRTRMEYLLEAAHTAALEASEENAHRPEFALLISCVGRRMVLDQRVEEELEAVIKAFENTPSVSGFYSYGELSPSSKGSVCNLHNQTMTLTTYSEN